MSAIRKKMRSSIFKHLDGIALCPTFLSIQKKGLLNELSEEKTSLSYLTQTFKCNEGYLNVALRLFCCQGWLTQEIHEDDVYFKKNNNRIHIRQNRAFSGSPRKGQMWAK